MRRLRILHLVNGLGLDGTSKVVQQLCEMDPRRYDVEVASLSDRISLTTHDDWNPGINVKVVRYDFDHDYSLRNYFRFIVLKYSLRKKAAEIIRYIKEVSPDIIHSHLQPRETVMAILAAEETKARVVFTDHILRFRIGSPFDFKTGCLARIYRLVYQRCFVVAVSSSIYESQKRYKLFNSSIGHIVIHNRIDTSRFFPVPKRPGHKLRVVYVARLEYEKGHETLLRAWMNIRSQMGAELVLIGSGSLEASLKDMIGDSELVNPIVFAGDQMDVAGYLQEAHVGVFPSLIEGLPLSLLEKMACALPVVVSDIPELKEIVTDGFNGLLFKQGCVEDLQVKIEKLLLDPELREALGANARRSIIETGKGRSLKDEYETVYQSVV